MATGHITLDGGAVLVTSSGSPVGIYVDRGADVQTLREEIAERTGYRLPAVLSSIEQVSDHEVYYRLPAEAE